MRVDLRGGDIRVPQNLLQDAQVSTAGEHMRGKGMAERVRMQALDAHEPAIALADRVDGLAREPLAASVQEDGIRRAAAARMGRELGAGAGEIRLERGEGGAHDGDEPLLRALPQHAQELVIQVEVALGEAAELAHAQAAAIEHLEGGAVARTGGRVGKGLVEERRHLIHGEVVGQMVGRLGKLDRGRGMRLCHPLAHEEAMPALGRGERAGNGGVGVTGRAFGGHEVLHVAPGHLIRPLDTALEEKRDVGIEVAPIARHRVGREVALEREVRQVLVAAALELGGTGERGGGNVRAHGDGAPIRISP